MTTFTFIDVKNVFNVFKNIFSNVRALKCLTETLTSTFGTIKTN